MPKKLASTDKTKTKYKTKLCGPTMKFADCELAILRHAVEKTEQKQGVAKVNNPEVKKMLSIVEDFLRKKQLICYGGTAINNILPKHAQFYKREIEMPDYDFFSDNPIEDAKELADIYEKNGYSDVEAKSGVHYGTFKVFVNFIPIADITFLHPEVYKSIRNESIKLDGILYAPPNFLRMSMYLELSRPDGDVSRWEKVLERLTLLNKYYPLNTSECMKISFKDNNSSPSSELTTIIRNSLVDNGVVFFGGYSTYLYSKYMPENEQNKIKDISEYDVLSENPKRTATILVESLKGNGYKKTKMIIHKEIGEIIPEHYEITVNNKSCAFIYKTIGCHSYNKITIDNKQVNVATIETILSFYLAFIYIKKKHYNKNRLLCISQFLFDLMEKNRLSDRGLLKRFTIKCYGKQKTLEDIRSEKTSKYKEFKDLEVDFTSKEYQMWFLKYNPYIKKKSTNKTRKNSPTKKTSKTKTSKQKSSFFF
tara:strand:+ start:451 stop:1890 length:1440 start_codon:yes stop_codon:yes gene_type:complete